MAGGLLAGVDQHLAYQAEGPIHRWTLLPRMQDTHLGCWGSSKSQSIWRSRDHRLPGWYYSYRTMETGCIPSPERCDRHWQWMWAAKCLPLLEWYWKTFRLGSSAHSSNRWWGEEYFTIYSGKSCTESTREYSPDLARHHNTICKMKTCRSMKIGSSSSAMSRVLYYSLEFSYSYS